MVEDYQENYGNGWISVYRSIKSHWVWSDPVKLKWWLTILFEVNHSNSKVALGYNIIEVKRGQSAKSLRTWASDFKTGVKSVTKFFDMLEKDGMIKRETVGKGKQSTTLLTVCNYDTYQNKETQRGTLKGTQETTQGKRNGVREGGTNNNVNNANNENNKGESAKDSLSKDAKNDSQKPSKPQSENLLVKWVAKNAPRVAKMKSPLTDEEAERIKRDFHKDFIIDIFMAMENYEPLHRKSRSANLTFRNWAKRDERYKKWISKKESSESNNHKPAF